MNFGIIGLPSDSTLKLAANVSSARILPAVKACSGVSKVMAIGLNLPWRRTNTLKLSFFFLVEDLVINGDLGINEELLYELELLDEELDERLLDKLLLLEGELDELLTELDADLIELELTIEELIEGEETGELMLLEGLLELPDTELELELILDELLGTALLDRV